jgi:hypothetical protein
MRSDTPFETIERAQGMPGEGLTHGPPATKNWRQLPQFSRIIRHSLRDGFKRLYALSPGTGLIAPVASTMRKHRCPLGISTGMPGPRDFTSASASFVGASDALPSRYVHRIPASRVVTIARNAPLIEAG